MMEDERETADQRAYRLEMTKNALDKLVPSPEEIAAEIGIVGNLSGEKPNYREIYGASFEGELGFSLIEDRAINWEGDGMNPKRLNPAEWIEIHAPSIATERAKKIVEVAKATQVSGKRGGLLGWLFGK